MFILLFYFIICFILTRLALLQMASNTLITPKADDLLNKFNKTEGSLLEVEG